jgi:hypothetical protein
MSQDQAVTSPNIERAEHDDANQAKRVLPVLWSGSGIVKAPVPLLDLAYDYIGFSNADGNGNYQTLAFKTGGSGGTTVRTITMSFDGNNNVTSVARS